MSGWGMRTLRLLVVLAAAIATAGAAMAEKRIALVIGNSSYQGGAFGTLNNPANDARLMEQTLKSLGFEVETLINASEDQMETAIGGLGERLGAAGKDAVGLFYFAGHGVQSQGRNYLIPVDARARTEQDVWNQAPRMGLVEQYMGYAGNRVNFIILDACRNNNLPSTTRGGSGLSPRLEKESEGVLVAYSAQPGATASDGAGGNSPYTAALARVLKEQAGTPAELLFKRVGDAVRGATKGAQQPWYESGLSGADFCFGGCGSALRTSPSAPADSVATSSRSVGKTTSASETDLSWLVGEWKNSGANLCDMYFRVSAAGTSITYTVATNFGIVKQGPFTALHLGSTEKGHEFRVEGKKVSFWIERSGQDIYVKNFQFRNDKCKFSRK